MSSKIVLESDLNSNEKLEIIMKCIRLTSTRKSCFINIHNNVIIFHTGGCWGLKLLLDYMLFFCEGLHP